MIESAPSAGRAMRAAAVGMPLSLVPLHLREPTGHQVLLAVCACGVCRTDLHLLDGELPGARFPVTPGHEIVGRVVRRGSEARGFEIGERVGVPWLALSCGSCAACARGEENLCRQASYTGCNVDGGYATQAIADERFCLHLPNRYSDTAAAPLLCAGLIGYRAYRACGEPQALGLYGFGAAAHILAQVAIAQGRRVFAFTRPDDKQAQLFARELGVSWAGGSDEAPPQELDAAIIFAPAGSLVPKALAAVRPGGRVVCAGIHMSDIPPFPYRLLWEERSVSSVANLTRRDGREFMAVAEQVDIAPAVECFPFERANDALAKLRAGTLRGAAVLTMPPWR